MEEKIDKEFLKQVSKNLEKGNYELRKYAFRLALIGGNAKDKKKAKDEFETKMGKMEIRKNNVDLRIEMLSTVGKSIKLKPNMTPQEHIKLLGKDSEFSKDETFDLIFTQSGKPLPEE